MTWLTYVVHLSIYYDQSSLEGVVSPPDNEARVPIQREVGDRDDIKPLTLDFSVLSSDSIGGLWGQVGTLSSTFFAYKKPLIQARDII